jgi:phenylalanyl-tRNA synthetase alpha chain
MVTDITKEMIQKGTWENAGNAIKTYVTVWDYTFSLFYYKSTVFKPYNFYSAGTKIKRGSIHPLIHVANQFKRVLLEMGFEVIVYHIFFNVSHIFFQEMPTHEWLETSFWNFDSLFQPQHHPARDMQDTFFIKVKQLLRFYAAFRLLL